MERETAQRVLESHREILLEEFHRNNAIVWHRDHPKLNIHSIGGALEEVHQEIMRGERTHLATTYDEMRSNYYKRVLRKLKYLELKLTEAENYLRSAEGLEYWKKQFESLPPELVQRVLIEAADDLHNGTDILYNPNSTGRAAVEKRLVDERHKLYPVKYELDRHENGQIDGRRNTVMLSTILRELSHKLTFLATLGILVSCNSCAFLINAQATPQHQENFRIPWILADVCLLLSLYGITSRVKRTLRE